MFVAIGKVRERGRLLGLGETVQDIDSWSAHVVQASVQQLLIRDATANEIEVLQARQRAVEVKDQGQRASRALREARAVTAQHAGDIERLTRELAEAEKRHENAETAEIKAEVRLEELRKTHEDVALGFAPEVVAPTVDPEADGETDEDAGPETPFDPELVENELFAKAISTIGGFTKSEMFQKIDEWYGVSLEDHVSTRANKAEVLNAAARIVMEQELKDDDEDDDFD